MDGLTAGVGCRSDFFDPWHLFSGYLASTIPGTIPSCLWSLPNITAVALSGNGLIGSLPNLFTSTSPEDPFSSSTSTTTTATLSPLLRNVAISFNRISGSIPLCFQVHGFDSLDLSHNMLCGDVRHMVGGYSSTTVVPVGNNSDLEVDEYGETYENESDNEVTKTWKNTVLSLDVNRLTGNIPASFLDIPDLYVLNGNDFECDAQHPLPEHDPSYVTYVCGSDEFENSLLASVVVFVFLVLLLLGMRVLTLLTSSTSVLHQQLLVWWTYGKEVLVLLWEMENTSLGVKSIDSLLLFGTTLATLQIHVPHTAKFIETLIFIRHLCISICAVICLFCLPLYLSFYFSVGKFYSHEQQYGWILSAAYLSGFYPALCVLIVFTLLCGYTVISISIVCSSSRMEDVTRMSLSYRDSLITFNDDDDDLIFRHNNNNHNHSNQHHYQPLHNSTSQNAQDIDNENENEERLETKANINHHDVSVLISSNRSSSSSPSSRMW